jgi:hypothetical protein
MRCWTFSTENGGKKMSEVNAKESAVDVVDRQAKCRFETEVRMHEVIKTLVGSGWLEVEVALALADAAEDHVLALARNLQ